MKTISVTQFQTNCAQFIEDVYLFHTEIIITNHEKPLVKLVSLSDDAPKALLGSFVGAGETIGDLTEPFTDEWEVD
jgi:prevent-host-death family protein